MRLRNSCKWVSQAVELQSRLVFDLAVEKSHNKTNAMMLMKEMVTMIKDIFGLHMRILFISYVWSEYLNNKKLRGLMVSELDTSKLCEFLRKEWCELLITRFKQDNGYVENKNKYIEIACLDNQDIASMNCGEFLECLQTYQDLNNHYLEASNKYLWVYVWTQSYEQIS